MIMILAGCVSDQIVEIGNPDGVDDNRKDQRGLIRGYAHQQGVTVEEARAFFAQVYGIEEENDITAKLPPVPKDFDQWKERAYSGEKGVVGIVPETIYTQPEFYPTFETVGKAFWVGGDGSIPYSVGIMGTPGKQEATITRGETETEGYLLIGASWGVTQRQGMGLRYELDYEPATPDEVPRFNLNDLEKIVRIRFTPQNLLIGKNFPTFDADWVQRVKIEGIVLPTAPPGIYVVRVFPTAPDPELEKAWGGQTYFRETETFSSGEGIATFTLRVNP
ncbi:MAG: hypothetical protein Q8P05_00080 [Candidatus Diapherotrites archaeon]|nr:hypothetical protein [Candidatus Diapherotrites archaeon]MDZ4256961.1 hypothetical protein [archaeon]